MDSPLRCCAAALLAQQRRLACSTGTAAALGNSNDHLHAAHVHPWMCRNPTPRNEPTGNTRAHHSAAVFVRRLSSTRCHRHHEPRPYGHGGRSAQPWSGRPLLAGHGKLSEARLDVPNITMCSCPHPSPANSVLRTQESAASTEFLCSTQTPATTAALYLHDGPSITATASFWSRLNS